MIRRQVQHGDAMAALLRIVDEPVLDLDALGRGLLRLSAMDQVLLGGVLMRIGRNADRYNLATLGEALACRGARRLSSLNFPTLAPEQDPT